LDKSGRGGVLRDSGVLVVGAFDGSVYGLQAFKRQLSQPEIASMTTASIRVRNGILTTESRVLGGAMIGIFVLCTVAVVAQLVFDTATNPTDAVSGVTQGANAGANAATSGRSAATNAARGSASAASRSASIAVAIPMIAGVLQVMQLYFTGWEWPIEFSVPFGFIYLPFSLDFVLAFPTLPITATLFVQPLFVLPAALCFAAGGRANPHPLSFQESVIDPMMAASEAGLDPFADATPCGLPEPDIDAAKALSIAPVCILNEKDEVHDNAACHRLAEAASASLRAAQAELREHHVATHAAQLADSDDAAVRWAQAVEDLRNTSFASSVFNWLQVKVAGPPLRQLVRSNVVPVVSDFVAIEIRGGSRPRPVIAATRSSFVQLCSRLLHTFDLPVPAHVAEVMLAVHFDLVDCTRFNDDESLSTSVVSFLKSVGDPLSLDDNSPAGRRGLEARGGRIGRFRHLLHRPRAGVCNLQLHYNQGARGS
jgi:hypothetical protein